MSWGKRIRIVFNGKLYNVTSALKNYFRLIETIYGTYIYPVNVTYRKSDQEIYLEFNDFYRAVPPLSLEYLGGTTFGGKDFVMDAFIIIPTIINLNPNDASDGFLKLAEIGVSGTIAVSFNGKMYADEYLQVNMSIAGTYLLITFNQRHDNEYLKLNTVTVSGQYCDINGIPL